MGFRNPILAGLQLVREAIQSDNFVTLVSGWSIFRNGRAEFQEAIIRGDVTVNRLIANDPTSGGQITIDPSTFGSNDTRIELTPAFPYGAGEDNALVGAQNQNPGALPTLTLRSPAELAGNVSQIDLRGEPSGGGSTAIEMTTDVVTVSNDEQVFGDLTVSGNEHLIGDLTLDGLFIPAYRAVNATVTNNANSNAFFDVTGLSRTLFAGAVHRYKLIMRYSATATANFKMQLTLPVGAVATAVWFWGLDTAGTPSMGMTTPPNAGVAGLDGQGATTLLFISEGIIIGGVANGTLQVQAGKNVAEASTVSVFRSMLEVEVIA